jgi:hypothetical protein
MMKVHYSPKTHTALISSKSWFAFKNIMAFSKLKKISILLIGEQNIQEFPFLKTIQLPLNDSEVANKLFASLRELDQTHADLIIVMVPLHLKENLWPAIYDRLKRASKTIIH